MQSTENKLEKKVADVKIRYNNNSKKGKKANEKYGKV